MNNNNHNQIYYENKKKDQIYNQKQKNNFGKKIKEITVDLSPRKKLLNPSNTNRNLNHNKVNNITPNYNYNLNDFGGNSYDDKFSLNNIDNIKVKPKSKIESCIITFDRPKKNNTNNYDKQYKLSNSLDSTKFNKLRYIKKKFQIQLIKIIII